jgi:glycosyltransferase involved in cell wall biosynthesis
VLTVLLATRNGVRTLPEVLQQYCRLETPRGGWKLVVIDNGSTDETRTVIHSYQQRLPLTYLFESQPGKNAALNGSLGSIAGDLIVLTDDDVFPRVSWMLEMRAAADAHPHYAVFGGTIVPRWEIPPESWITSWVPLAPTFSVSDPSTPEGPTDAHTVFGPNMAIRASVFARGYRFDPQIGPRGSSYAMGSETEFVRRLLREGFTAWHCRRSVVEHFIPRSHMRTSWILARAVRFGRGQYRLGVRDQRPAFPSCARVPRYLFGEMLVQQGRMVSALVSSDEEKLFRARWQFNYLWGQMSEARAVHAEKSRDMRSSAVSGT